MSRNQTYRIKTVVVEDEVRILNNICKKIRSLDESFEIAGTAVNGEQALKTIEELRPQVVFTDISMPVMDGMEFIKLLRKRYPSIVIVIISGYSSFTYAQQSMKYGVFNYLLKPLENETLLDTLFDIKKQLSHFTVQGQRNIIYSDNYELEVQSASRFLVAEVCIGNVISYPQSEEVEQFYRGAVSQIPWMQIMERITEHEAQWFVADDHTVNQKVVVLKVGEAAEQENRELLDRLMRELCLEIPLHITVCGTGKKVLQDELWDTAKLLRNTIKQRLVVGENAVFYQEEESPAAADMLEIVKMKMNVYIKNYYLSTDLENFINEIQLVFKYMKANHAPQEHIEKMCIYILKLLEFSDKDYNPLLLEQIQADMMKNISLAFSEEELFQKLVEDFQKVNQYMAQIGEDSLEENLLTYVDDHFLTIESVEQVAEELNYNYAYLSRIFKKKTGQSMNKYLTARKIALAKELLETREDIKLAEVSDLCGYHDWRYFSRVFRTETGHSPTEYKEQFGAHSASEG